MLAGTTAKRLSGLVLPLVIGGSVLAVRAASASNLQAAAGGACTTTSSTTTTGGSGLPFPTTLPPLTLPGGGGGSSTTTTATGATTTTVCETTTTGKTTTTAVNCAAPTPTTAGATTTTAASVTTTTATGATTTTSGLPVPTTLPGTTTTACPTTTTSSTTTTIKPTTTTVPQTPVRITSIASDHVAGHAAKVNGTAAANKLVILSGTDRKTGKHELGEATSAANGSWHISLAHGVLYNTVLQASTGTQKSNTAHLNVHQVLKITSIKQVSEGSRGFTYKLTGKSASHVPNEAITVLVNGKAVGKGKMRSNGTFTVKFLVKNKSEALKLHGTGRSGSGVEYTLAGNKKFHVH